MVLSIEVPDELLRAMRVPTEEAPSRLKRELAVRLYAKGLLSFGNARRLSGMTRWEFHELVGQEGVRRRYDVEELGKDLETLEQLSQGHCERTLLEVGERR